jgi:hypothetical protein
VLPWLPAARGWGTAARAAPACGEAILRSSGGSALVGQSSMVALLSGGESASTG